MTVLKVPEGATVCPSLLLPQHVMVLLLRSPQECNLPAVTALKVPEGASAFPSLLLPQHVMVLLLRSPQE